MQTVLISGGSGLIGSALSQLLLGKGYKVIILTRHLPSKPSEDTNLSYAEWDTKKQEIDEGALKKADYIVHLAGAGVADKRWTDERKKVIVESRLSSSQLLYNTLKQIPHQVKAFISASAIGYYGEGEEPPFTETDQPAQDFLGKTCEEWENSVRPIAGLGIRLVILRTGIALSREGGALKELAKPVKFGIAGILGSGDQWVSWIHIRDLCRMYLCAIEDENMKGVFNAVAPNPVKHKQLILTTARTAKGRNYIPLPVPAFILKIILGEMSTEVLKSCKVSSGKISQKGFQFSYPTIESAISALWQNKKG